MLSDEDLLIAVRKLAKVGQKPVTLLILAHVSQPAVTAAVRERAMAIGFRSIEQWNLSGILRASADDGYVAQLKDGWKLLEPGLVALSSAGVDLNTKPISKPSDSVLPRELVIGTRSYVEKVVSQINGSYDHGYYDCCAVMCRRLGETLIIEVYESQGRANEIKGSDGNFLMLNGLLSALSRDVTIHLGRNAKRGLEGLKDLGDKSAHNRRFNARRADIETIKSDLRVATEELLHLAKLT